jgi:hypothetical protein
MNIDRCDNLCCTDAGASTATATGIELVREALDFLGRPYAITYSDIADAFVGKDKNGEPHHGDGFQEYLKLNTDLTCNCVLGFVLRQCGYTDICGNGIMYVRGAR